MEKRQYFETKNDRKIHDRDVPGLGGIAFIVCIFIVMLFGFPFDEIAEIKYLIGSLIVITIVGLRDDILPLSAFSKLMGNAIPCVILYFLYDIRIDSFFSLGNWALPLWVALPLTCFVIIIITNSYNLIDGIDGLAASLTIVSLAVFGVYYYATGHAYLAYFQIMIIGSLVGFLYYNFPPAKIFMGDTGALFLGFMMATNAILFMNINESLENPFFSASVGTAMSFISVPLFDTFRIILFRLRQRKSPLSADSHHIHHMLLKLGWNHLQIGMAYVSVQVSTVALVYLFPQWNDLTVMTFLGAYFFLLLYLVQRALKSKTEKAGV